MRFTTWRIRMKEFGRLQDPRKSHKKAQKDAKMDGVIPLGLCMVTLGRVQMAACPPLSPPPPLPLRLRRLRVSSFGHRVSALSRTLGVGVLCMAMAMTAGASETSWWVVDDVGEMLEGSGEGVAVSADGMLRPVEGWRRQATLEEPVVLAVDRLPGGDLVVVTGHPARLYRVSGSSVKLLAQLPGEQATSILVDGDGAVWVTTVAPGVLVKWSGGELEEMGRLGDGGFWDLVEFDHTIVAAAGTPGALYKVGDKGLERWLEVPDAFVRSLVVDGDRLIAGTSGKGLILSINRSGRASLLVDSPFTEISDMVVTEAGELWATALVGEPPPKSTKASSAVQTGNGGKSGNGASATTESLNLDLPKINGKTATSELVRVTKEGGLLHVHRFEKQVVMALGVDGDGVLAGTGYEGEVWRFVTTGGARLATLDAVQVTAFAAGGALVTQGPAAVWSTEASGRHDAKFRSAAKAFERPVRFGRYQIFPEDSGATIRFRTGVGAKPDDLWLPWTEFSGGDSGRVALDFGRALQWELKLVDGSEVDRVEVAWTEINLAPVVKGIDIEPPGLVYLSSPPVSGPVIRQEHPTFDGIFTTVGENGPMSQNAKKGKKYWQVGYRTVSWRVQDANGDPLIFNLEVERSDGFRIPVRKKIKGNQLALDTSALPDGRYRFQLEASDVVANPGAPMSGEGVSPWFVVDNTAPEVVITAKGQRWAIEVLDGSSLARVQMSRDGSSWEDILPIDGLLDGPVERFEIEVEEGRHLVVIRAIDRHHNRTVAGVEE